MEGFISPARTTHFTLNLEHRLTPYVLNKTCHKPRKNSRSIFYLYYTAVFKRLLLVVQYLTCCAYVEISIIFFTKVLLTVTVYLRNNK